MGVMEELESSRELIDPMVNQGDVWPSSSKQGQISIASMHPNHAFNAWHRMQDIYEGSWKSMQHSTLAMSLLRRALGEQTWAWLDTTEPQRTDTQVMFELTPVELFGMCYEAIDEIEEFKTIQDRLTLATRITGSLIVMLGKE